MNQLTHSQTLYRPARKQPRKGRRSQLGFTLLELMVSVGIMGALGGIIASSSFAMLRAQADTNSNSQVAIEVSKSTRWIARDIHRATSSDVVDSAPAVDTASLTWTENGSVVSCGYSVNVVDNSLERSCGGNTAKVAKGVSNLQFTRSGDLIDASYTITSELDASRTEDVQLLVLLGGG